MSNSKIIDQEILNQIIDCIRSDRIECMPNPLPNWSWQQLVRYTARDHSVLSPGILIAIAEIFKFTTPSLDVIFQDILNRMIRGNYKYAAILQQTYKITNQILSNHKFIGTLLSMAIIENNSNNMNFIFVHAKENYDLAIAETIKNTIMHSVPREEKEDNDYTGTKRFIEILYNMMQHNSILAEYVLRNHNMVYGQTRLMILCRSLIQFKVGDNIWNALTDQIVRNKEDLNTFLNYVLPSTTINIWAKINKLDFLTKTQKEVAAEYIYRIRGSDLPKISSEIAIHIINAILLVLERPCKKDDLAERILFFCANSEMRKLIFTPANSRLFTHFFSRISTLYDVSENSIQIMSFNARDIVNTVLQDGRLQVANHNRRMQIYDEFIAYLQEQYENPPDKRDRTQYKGIELPFTHEEFTKLSIAQQWGSRTIFEAKKEYYKNPYHSTYRYLLYLTNSSPSHNFLYEYLLYLFSAKAPSNPWMTHNTTYYMDMADKEIKLHEILAAYYYIKQRDPRYLHAFASAIRLILRAHNHNDNPDQPSCGPGTANRVYQLLPLVSGFSELAEPQNAAIEILYKYYATKIRDYNAGMIKQFEDFCIYQITDPAATSPIMPSNDSDDIMHFALGALPTQDIANPLYKFEVLQEINNICINDHSNMLALLWTRKTEIGHFGERLLETLRLRKSKLTVQPC